MHHLPPSHAPQAEDQGHISPQILQLRRLAELGMLLAEAAARLALADMAEPKPDPEPVAAPEPDAPPLFWPLPTELPRPPRDPALLFIRLARAVRDCIALQNRLTAQHEIAARTIADPRRPILRRALRRTIASQPDNPINLIRVDRALDLELEADPDRLTPITEILALTCEDLGLDPADIDLQPLPPCEIPTPEPKPPRTH